MRRPGGILLAASNICPKCGFANQPGYHFCANCGAAITSGAPPAAPMAAPPAAPGYAYPPPAYAYGPPPWEMERRKHIDRTKTGLLLLLIGILLSWVPVIAAIGYLLILIGAILMFMGRKAFSPAHARNSGISIGLIIAGVIGFIAVFIIFIAALLSGTIQSQGNLQAAAAAIASALNVFLIGVLIVTAIFGIALVLVSLALQAQAGRILTLAAFGSGLGIQVALYVVVMAAVSAILSGQVTDATIQELIALSNQTTTLGLLNVIPSVLFAAAYYLAWSRVNRGEIPAPAAAPGVMPPPGSMPPGEMPPPIHPK